MHGPLGEAREALVQTDETGLAVLEIREIESELLLLIEGSCDLKSLLELGAVQQLSPAHVEFTETLVQLL